jgi:hypothetical protein
MKTAAAERSDDMIVLTSLRAAISAASSSLLAVSP